MGAGQAVEIYQWQDSSGVTHFTDNAMQVPMKYQKTAKRNVDQLRASSGGASVWNRGQTLWLDKCATCHTTGESDKDKLGLAMLTVDKKTKLPATLDAVVVQLRAASDGELPKMQRLDVSDADLKLIASYILGVK